MMALITCIECGKVFSDKALACPVCACPTEYILNFCDNKCLTECAALNTPLCDFQIEDNVLVKYIGNAGNIQVPFGVRGIAKAAFRCCQSVQNIELPETIEFIERQAFEACLNLKEITIPPLVKTIPEHTFRNCRALRSVFLPEGLQKISAYAFSRCHSLTNVFLPSTLVSVSRCAFNGCHFSMTNICYNGLRKEFEKLNRQHRTLYGLYRVLCNDGVWDCFDESTHGTDGSFIDEDYPQYLCEMCGKSFVPAIEHVYKDCDEDLDSENFYCSWSCFRKRDDECCPTCGRNFVIERDENGKRRGAYDEEYDCYFCSWECLEEFLQKNE